MHFASTRTLERPGSVEDDITKALDTRDAAFGQFTVLQTPRRVKRTSTGRTLGMQLVAGCKRMRSHTEHTLSSGWRILSTRSTGRLTCLMFVRFPRLTLARVPTGYCNF